MIQANPNLIAYAAIFVWPIVAVYLFVTRPLPSALIWTILGGYLLLPVGTVIKIAMIPGLDKNSIPAIAASVGCYFIARAAAPIGPRKWGLAELFVVAVIICPFATSQLNQDALEVGGVYGGFVIPGVGIYDAASASLSQYIVLIPFLLARRFLRRAEDSALVIRTLAIAGMVYTLPMLFEVRMSPQLHTWIYGYFPHSFEQQVRDDGFRPVVFLGHGLQVAFFCMSAIVASAALWKARVRVVRSFAPAFVTAWLAAVLVLCKSLASLVYAVMWVPLTLYVSPKLQLRVAAALVSVSLAYPMLRAVDLFPAKELLSIAGSVSAERAASLNVRFQQEEMLLAHIEKRPWFGWGRFGRGRVYDETGKDISITDGHWIVVMTTFGIIGFLAEFGLVAFVVFRAVGSLRFARSDADKAYLTALASIVAIGLVDQLPNATTSPWSWLLCGALLGRAEQLRYAKSTSTKSSSRLKKLELPTRPNSLAQS